MFDPSLLRVTRLVLASNQELENIFVSAGKENKVIVSETVYISAFSAEQFCVIL